MQGGQSEHPAEPGPVFAAVITPHRSLSPGGFRVTMIGLGAVMLVPAAYFTAMGYWPVAGFLGLDLLGLYIALRVSFGRQERSFEEVELTPVALTLRRADPRGRMTEWRFNPAWTKLQRQEDAEYGLLRLSLVSRDLKVVVAGALSPPERADFADALGEALARVKRRF